MLKDGLKKAQDFALSKGGQCLSNEYLGSRIKLEWKCSNPDHPSWSSKYNTTVTQRKWCSICGKNNISEDKVRLFFESFFKKPFKSIRPNWNKNPKTNHNLELDGYNEELKIAFEHDGEHHFQVGINFKTHTLTESDLEYQKYKDEQKKINCIKNGIILVNIPFLIRSQRTDFNSFLIHVQKHCAKNGIHMIFNDQQLKSIKNKFFKI